METEASAGQNIQQFLDRLRASDRMLHLSALLVQSQHPVAARAMHDILAFLTSRYPGIDIIGRYAVRVGGLVALQQKFDKDPRVENLGDPTAQVSRDDYNLSLLLSIVLTHHRFEIMGALSKFIEEIPKNASRIVSIGAGTGYELRELALKGPPSARVQAYDLDPTVQEEARRFLDFFAIAREVEWPSAFALDSPSPDCEGQLDAIILCEVLEHLPDPLGALRCLRACLAPRGRIFLTMAVNIAQEDHVFLYPTIASCREQLAAAGLVAHKELVTPVTLRAPGLNREHGFKKGNYVAIAHAAD